MTVFVTFLIANDGPLSPVFVHLTSIARVLPFASHGFAKEPGPAESGGQSCCGSGAALAVALGAVLAAGGADDAAGGGAADALADAAAPEDSSFEQPRRAIVATAGMSQVRIRAMLPGLARVACD